MFHMNLCLDINEDLFLLLPRYFYLLRDVGIKPVNQRQQKMVSEMTALRHKSVEYTVVGNICRDKTK